jgi:hypothetical protein
MLSAGRNVSPCAEDRNIEQWSSPMRASTLACAMAPMLQSLQRRQSGRRRRGGVAQARITADGIPSWQPAQLHQSTALETQILTPLPLPFALQAPYSVPASNNRRGRCEYIGTRSRVHLLPIR